ncbi:MAG TPA: DUF1176 domain-containing protein [Bdellovibrionales bacterium]|nr:DUF1176 domain-containing protein [Bdellovibrionales bacterium]
MRYVLSLLFVFSSVASADAVNDKINAILNADSECALVEGEEREPAQKFEFTYKDYDGNDVTMEIYQANCMNGAYNFVSRFFIKSPDYDQISPVSFAQPKVDYVIVGENEAARVKSWTIVGYTAMSSAVNAEFDPVTKTIVTYAKYRGIGDASSSGTWVYDDASYEFVLKRFMEDPTFNTELDPIEIVNFN